LRRNQEELNQDAKLIAFRGQPLLGYTGVSTITNIQWKKRLRLIPDVP